MNFTMSPNHTDNVTVTKIPATTLDCNGRKTNEENQVETFENIASYLWIVVSPILFGTGVFGNISIVAVLRKLQFWKKPTYLFIFILALSDTTVLSVGLSRYWIREVFTIDIRSLSEWGCKVNVFVIYFSMQFSSAVLVCVTFERFLKTRFPFRYNIIVSVRKCSLLIVTVFLVLTALNVFWFVTQGLVKYDDGFSCEATTSEFFWFEEFVYIYIDLSVLSIIPFVTMAIMNISIQRVLLESKNLRETSVSDETTRKELGKFSRVLTRMLLFTSTYFLISTVPISIYYIMDSYLAPDAGDLTMAKMDVAWAVTYLFQFSNYSANFFLYMSTNKAFERTFKQMFCCKSNTSANKKDTRTMKTTQLSRMTTIDVRETSNLPEISRNTEVSQLAYI